MAVNKVIYGGEVKIDLTQDTVSPSTLLEGTTAHDAAGNIISGTLVIKNEVEVSDTPPTDPDVEIWVDTSEESDVATKTYVQQYVKQYVEQNIDMLIRQYLESLDEGEKGAYLWLV